MAKDIVMPKLGYDMTEGKLLRWLKQEGDAVSKGDAVAEIETDKVNIEVEAFDSGVLRRIVVPEGQTVPVGERIAILAAPDETLAEEAKPAADATPEAKAPAQAETPTTKAPAQARPPAGSDGGVSSGNGNAPGMAIVSADESGRIKASPLARRLAQEHGLDLSAVRGTGPGGRVTRDDVLGAAPGGAAHVAPAPVAPAPATQPAATPAPAPQAAPVVAASAGEKPLSRLQQTMGRRMVESKTQAPHFYLTIHVDVTAAMALRQQLNAQAEEGVKLSINDLIVKATARALSKFPAFNSSFAGDKLTLHSEINVAIAVAIDEGLVTPVVRNADQKSLGHISRETKELAERARTGKAKLEDYEGGTFTISNLGMFDIDTFVAIINPPQAAILAIGAARRVPVYVGDELVPRERMSITLSADHRVTDGANGARFLAEVRGLLENPMRLLI